MQLPTSCALTTGNGNLMHNLIRQQQQSSDMF